MIAIKRYCTYTYTKEWCGFNSFNYWNRTIILCMLCISVGLTPGHSLPWFLRVFRGVGKLVTFNCVECAVKRREEACVPCVICLAENKTRHFVRTVLALLLTRAVRLNGRQTPPNLCPDALSFGDLLKTVTCASRAVSVLPTSLLKKSHVSFRASRKT